MFSVQVTEKLAGNKFAYLLILNYITIVINVGLHMATANQKRIGWVVYSGRLEPYLIIKITFVRIGYSLGLRGLGPDW